MEPVLEIIDTLFEWAWTTSIAGSITFALIWVMARAFGEKLSPKFRYALAVVAVFRFLVPFSPESRLSMGNLWRSGAEVQVLNVRLEEVPTSLAIPIKSSVTIGLRERQWTWQDMLGSSWLAVVLALTATAIARHAAFAKKVREMVRVKESSVLQALKEAQQLLGNKSDITVRLYCELETPVVFGMWRTNVLLPSWVLARSDQEELRAIFLHEVAHIKRRDVALNWVLIAARALHWFNPLAWKAVHFLLVERELVCDAMALRSLDSRQRRCYGETLLEAAAHNNQRALPLTSSAIAQDSQIERRIRMINKIQQKHRSSMIAATFLTAVLAVVTFTRAAEKPEPASNVRTEPPRRDKVRGEGLAMLREELSIQEARLDQLGSDLAQLRNKIGPNDSATLADRVRDLHKQTGAIEDQLRSVESMYVTLRQLAEKSNYEALNSFVDDANLKDLMKTRYNLHQELTRKSRDYSDEHPSIQELKAVVKQVEEQLRSRVEGIVEAARAKEDILKLQKKRLLEDVNDASKNQLLYSQQAVPYERALRAYESQTRIVETLKMRLLAEMVDSKFVADRNKE